MFSQRALLQKIVRRRVGSLSPRPPVSLLLLINGAQHARVVV